MYILTQNPFIIRSFPLTVGRSPSLPLPTKPLDPSHLLSPSPSFSLFGSFPHVGTVVADLLWSSTSLVPSLIVDPAEVVTDLAEVIVDLAEVAVTVSLLLKYMISSFVDFSPASYQTR